MQNQNFPSNESASTIGDNVFSGGIRPNLLTDCFTNDTFNTCLFWKNPVAQSGRAISPPISTTTSLSNLQTHAVTILESDYDNSGNLKNASIDVFTVDSELATLERVKTTSKVFKYAFDPKDVNHKFSQVMAFYWINLQIQFMIMQTGQFHATNRNIKVASWIPETDNAYYNYANNAVLIGDGSNGNEYALGAEVYLHEMGHANFQFATNSRITQNVDNPKMKECSQNLCCTTANGCNGAINEGQADYHVAIMFPTQTAFGETLQNSVNGISECRLSRAVDASKNLSSQDAFKACGSQGLGEIHLLGRIYASIWWEVRKAVAGSNITEQKNIDKLFSQHLTLFAATDDFVDAFNHIRATDSTFFAGKYSESFKNEFIKRGITVQ